jgi:hypothetical protein
VGAGSRESLAGRFERLTLTHWPAPALTKVFGLPREESAHLTVRLGSYPGAMPLRNDLARWRAYVRDAIIEPAIGRDLLALHAVRRPALRRQVFALCTGMPAQIVSLQKLQGQLHDPGALETIAHYLELLEQAFLVAGLEKFGERVHRRRAAPPKLVTLNNALLSAMHPAGPPDLERDPARFGAWVENACLAHAWNCEQQVRYWRGESLEVDAVLEGSILPPPSRFPPVSDYPPGPGGGGAACGSGGPGLDPVPLCYYFPSLCPTNRRTPRLTRFSMSAAPFLRLPSLSARRG